MKTQSDITGIESEVHDYNEGINTGEYSEDVFALVRSVADEVIEEQTSFIHFRLGTRDYEITWHQDHHGHNSMHLHPYEND